jgi:hypothetical protein
MIWKSLKTIGFILTLRCDQASRLLSLAQESPLNRAERLALSLHLLICRVCRKYRRQLALMRNVLARLTQSEAYDDMSSSLLDEGQSHALQERLSRNLHKKLDSL